MAYNDQYTSKPNRLQRKQSDAQEFNPYSFTQPHGGYEDSRSYDNYGYRDDPQYNYDYPNSSARAQPQQHLDDSPPGGQTPASKELEAGGFVPGEKKTASAMRNYRYVHRGGLWTKGSRGRCIGRFCCCTIMVAILVIVSIVLSLALWIRPPNIEIGDVQPVQKDGSTISLIENGISISLGVNISVNNPNYFAVNLKQVKAEIFYPLNNTLIGEGLSKDVVFPSHQQTNWTFPFAINYKTDLDPNNAILFDLAQRCGVAGSKSDLKVDYKIRLGVRILFITISPTINNSATFTCPIDPKEIQSIISSIGANFPGLSGPN